MKWMKDRDLLIAQTMAFVQSVTGKKPEAEKTVVSSVTRLSVEISSRSDAPAPMPDIEALLAVSGAVAEPSRPVPMARPGPRDDIQSEIRARIASFRAHQERFNREREAYCSATMAKVHAALRDGELPPRLGK
jgi:hypothetical protein